MSSCSEAVRAMFSDRMRILAVLSALVMCVGVAAGCGGDDDDTNGQTQETTAEQTTGEATDAEQTDGTTAEEPSDGAAAGDASAGQQVFADTCASCHGPQGEGASAPALTAAGDAAAVEEQVRNGGGGMPPFGDQLSDQEISNVTAFVTEEVASE